MTSKNPKLELTWIGKKSRPLLEPSILLKDPARSNHAEHRVSDADTQPKKRTELANRYRLLAQGQQPTTCSRSTCGKFQSVAVARLTDPRCGYPSVPGRLQTHHLRHPNVQIGRRTVPSTLIAPSPAQPFHPPAPAGRSPPPPGCRAPPSPPGCPSPGPSRRRGRGGRRSR